jgi:predicted nucleic acid-binding protein
VTLLDAYVLVAFLVGGPAADDALALIRAGRAGVVTANLAEALDVSHRVHGLPIARAMEELGPLIGSAITLVVVDAAIAQRAAEIRGRHYHRSTRPISLADCMLIAAAGHEDRIATADPDVLAVAAAESLPSIALPGEG